MLGGALLAAEDKVKPKDNSAAAAPIPSTWQVAISNKRAVR